LGNKEQTQIRQLIATLDQAIAQIDAIPWKAAFGRTPPVKFFQAPTHTIITNSSDQTLNVYYQPAFGKHLMNQSNSMARSKNVSTSVSESTLPPVDTVIEFIKAFDYVRQSNGV
jgi:hypothetical protein